MSPDIPRQDLEAILSLVARAKDLDVRDYRHTTLIRRIAFRMERAGCSSSRHYLERLDADRGELDRLAQDLLIHVTSFLRDPGVFEALRSDVVPRLLSRVNPGEVFHAWVVGASSGEEAYSLAMVLASACAASGVAHRILATDRAGSSLDLARAGVYPEDALSPVPPDARRRWFLPAAAGRFAVAPELRERISFVEHDFMGTRLAPAEAVLASFDLVLCRNVLIYLDERFRELAFERLATVVRGGGALVLGLAEALPAPALRTFEPFPAAPGDLRIFRRCD